MTKVGIVLAERNMAANPDAADLFFVALIRLTLSLLLISAAFYVCTPYKCFFFFFLKCKAFVKIIKHTYTHTPPSQHEISL